jgi:uncharacterized protein YigE (DUF2233 family)
MKRSRLIVFILLLCGLFSFKQDKDQILSYTADPKKENIQLFWKNDTGLIRNLKTLKAFVESKNKDLVFAMNGGMYMEDNSPLGLFIQDHKQIRKPNIAKGYNGNFYLQPNGVFYLNDDKSARVCQTSEFNADDKIKYATQSGPMLVVNGEIHPAFKEGSSNLNIRNGVGILADGKVLFAMSKNVINFYDFAKYFKDRGCKNALYLDGFVSRTYLPEKNWAQLDGNFGVIIGITKEKVK